MSDLAQLGIAVDTSGVRGGVSSLKDLTAAGTKAESSLKSLGATTLKTGQLLSIGLTAPLLLLGRTAVKMSIDFNAGMANVATLIPGNITRVKQLKAAVSDLSISTGKDVEDLAAGLYEVVSAFGDTAQTAKVLGISAKASVAGLSSTKEAIDLLSAVTKGYGDTSEAAVQQVADLSFITVKLGQTNFPELAASIGRVTPLAAELGVTQRELFSVMATGTGVTGKAAEVSTQFRSVLQALLSPTKEMTELLKQQEFASGKAMRASLGLQETLRVITAEAKRTNTPLQDFISSIEGQTLALALTGAQADTFTEKMKVMEDVTGAMDTAFDEQTKGINKLGFQYNKLTKRLSAVARDVGDILAPFMERLNSAIDRGVSLWASLDQSTKAAIVTLGAVAAAMGPLLVGLSLAITLISPWALLATAIISVGTAGLVIARNWKTIGPALVDIMDAVFDTVLHIISEFNNSLPPFLQAIVGNFDATIGAGLFVALAGAWLLGGKRLMAALGAIRLATAGALLLISRLFVGGAIAYAVYTLADQWDKDNDGKLTVTLNKMVDNVRSILSTIPTTFDELIESGNYALEGFVESVNRHLGGVLDKIRAFLTAVGSFLLGEAIKNATDLFSGEPQQSWKELDETIKGTQQNIEKLNQSMVAPLFDDATLQRSKEVQQAIDEMTTKIERLQAISGRTNSAETMNDYRARINEQKKIFEEVWQQLQHAQELGNKGLIESTQRTLNHIGQLYQKLFSEFVFDKPTPQKSSFLDGHVAEAKAQLVSLNTFHTKTFQSMGQEVMGWGKTVQNSAMDTKESVAKELAEVREQMRLLDTPKIDTSAIDQALGQLKDEGAQLTESVLKNSRQMSSGLNTEIIPTLRTFSDHVDRIKQKMDVLGQRLAETTEGKVLLELFTELKFIMGSAKEESDKFQESVANIPGMVDKALTESATVAKSSTFWDAMNEGFKGFGQTLQSTLNQMVSGVLQGTLKMSEAFKQLGQNIILSFTNSAINNSIDSLVKSVTEKTTQGQQVAANVQGASRGSTPGALIASRTNTTGAASGTAGALAVGGTALGGAAAGAGFGFIGKQAFGSLGNSGTVQDFGQKGALAGGIVGGIVGSIIPGLGTALGAVAGTVLGGTLGASIGGVVDKRTRQNTLIGAGIGTAVLPGFGTILGAAIGALLTGKAKKPEITAATTAGAQGNALEGAFGFVSTRGSRGGGAGETVLRDSLLKIDNALADHLTSAQVEIVKQTLISKKTFNEKSRKVGDAVSEVIQERLRLEVDAIGKAFGVSGNLGKTLLKGDKFSEKELQGVFDAIKFIKNFNDANKNLSRGLSDVTATARTAAQELVGSTLASIVAFKEETQRLGLPLQQAEASTKAFVEIMVGLRDAAPPLTEVQQALAKVHATFEELSPLLREVGITSEQAAEGLARSLQKIRDDFGKEIQRQITSFQSPIQNTINDLIAVQGARIEDGKAVGAKLHPVWLLMLEEFKAIARDLDPSKAGEARASIIAGLQSLGRFNESYINQAVTAFDNSLSKVGDTAGNTVDELARLRDSLRDFRDSLTQGQFSTLSPEQKFLEAQSTFNSTAALALGGNLEAMKKLQDVATNFLSANQEFNASSNPAAMARVLSVLDQITASGLTPQQQLNATAENIDLLQSQLAKEQQSFEAQVESLDSLGRLIAGQQEQTETLKEIAMTTKDGVKAVDVQTAALVELLQASLQETATYTRTVQQQAGLK